MATSMPNPPFPESSSQAEAGDESAFPKSGPATSAADAIDAAAAAAADRDMLRRVVQGAHEAVDRIADKAIPAVERLRERVDETSDRLHERAAQVGELKDEWAESLRMTIRERPLTAVLTALAVGVIISRLTSSDR
jgi:ElaB/YqjD/DUF883 family membrane-anchored ribosome-binding protein